MSKMRVNSVESLDGQSNVTVEDLATINKRTIYVGSVAELEGLAAVVGQKVSTLGYYSSGDGGGNEYEIVAGGTGTADGGRFIDLDNGLQARGIFDGAINVRKFGAKGDGAHEDTPHIRSALAFGSIYFTDGEYMINPAEPGGANFGGIKVPSNRNILLSERAKLRAIPVVEGLSSVLTLEGSENVAILNCNIQGERHTHLGSTGEFGMGLVLRNTKNVTVVGGTVSECWGDGIYVGQISDQGWCQSTRLSGVTCIGNRRNGLSLISASEFNAVNCKFLETAGTDPQAGVDIEPNNVNGRLDAIVFDTCTFSGNVNYGVLVAPISFSSTLKPVSIKFRDCYGYENGVTYAVTGTTSPLAGSIVFEDCTSDFSDTHGYLFRAVWDYGPLIKIIRPVIVDFNRSGAASDTEGAAISVLNRIVSGISQPSGNIEIEDPRFRLTSLPAGATDRKISLSSGDGGKIRNVSIRGIRNYDASIIDSSAHEAEWEIETISVTEFPFQKSGNISYTFSAYTGDPPTVQKMDYTATGNSVSVTGSIVFAVSTDDSIARMYINAPRPPLDGAIGQVIYSDTTEQLRVVTELNSIFFEDHLGARLGYDDLSGKRVDFSITYTSRP